MKELRRTVLVQRAKNNITKKNPPSVFSFGGGLRYGGVDPELMSKLNEVIHFEYMGSSEFEFGILNDSLNTIIRNYHNYVKTTVFKGGKIIYVICNKDEYEEVNKRIEELADGLNYSDNVFLKEDTDLKNVLENEGQETHVGTCCWFELDNNFIFTTNTMVHFKLDIILQNEWEKQNPKRFTWFGKLINYLTQSKEKKS